MNGYAGTELHDNPPTRVSTPTGLGFHYYPDTDHYTSGDLDKWLPELRDLGVRWLTVRGELSRAIPESFVGPLISAGITPIVHIPVHPIRSLDTDDLCGLLRVYANWGVQYVVLFDRANARESWQAGDFQQPGLPERFVECWLPVARAQIESGLTPVLPPLQQGGTYWDTSFLSSVLRVLIDKGAKTVIDQLTLAVYSFAFAKPPDWGRGASVEWPESRPYLTPPGSQDQRGFWSFEWYAEVLSETLGDIRPMIMLGGGARRSEKDPLTGDAMDLAWHTTCNSSIARAMHAGHLPDYLRNVNFWLMNASDGTEYAEDSWYLLDGKHVPAADELRRLAAKTMSANGDTGKAFVDTFRSPKPLGHYVLLPKFEWGPSEWHWAAAGPLVREENATCGYSLDAAVQAQKVTLLGGENEFGPEVSAQLREAGCNVIRMDNGGKAGSMRSESSIRQSMTKNEKLILPILGK